MSSPVSKGTIALAVVFAAGGFVYASMRPTPANILLMAPMLLLAWSMAFAPRPLVRSSVRGVYAQARAGLYRTSTTAKLVSLAATVLFMAGICLNLFSES